MEENAKHPQCNARFCIGAQIAIAIINSGAFNQDDVTLSGEMYGNVIIDAVKTIQRGLNN